LGAPAETKAMGEVIERLDGGTDGSHAGTGASSVFDASPSRLTTAAAAERCGFTISAPSHGTFPVS
jgi:hypothetical protein